MEIIEYKRERTEFSDEAHTLAKEITEAINAYTNDVKGDEIKESMDVGMLIGSMLMTSRNKDEQVSLLLDVLMLVVVNAGKASLEK